MDGLVRHLHLALAHLTQAEQAQLGPEGWYRLPAPYALLPATPGLRAAVQLARRLQVDWIHFSGSGAVRRDLPICAAAFLGPPQVDHVYPPYPTHQAERSAGSEPGGDGPGAAGT